MDAFETLTAAMLAPAPAGNGLPAAALPYPELAAALAWSLAGALLCSAAALATQVDALRAWTFRRVHAVRAAARRLAPPRRSRAGGSNGRVPPRPAAGSPPL
ncbi:hypothetical protein KF840_10125 [bacterium]|nr:hypothetical protein [bacterium]